MASVGRAPNTGHRRPPTTRRPSTTQRPRRRRQLGLAAIVVLAGAAYGGYLLLAGHVRNEALPAQADGFTDECGTSGAAVAFPAAARYTGNGPHPIIIGTSAGNTSPGAGIAPAWRDQPLPWRPANPRTVQLIACGTVTQAGHRTVTTCTFGNSLTGVQSAPMYPGRWDITVYAARTGQVVGHAQFVGDQADCPTVAFAQNGQVPSQLTDPGIQQLRAALARYVR